MTTTITRPAPHAAYVRRGTCLGKRDPDCTAATHGTQAAYVSGCRCPHARDDHRIYQKRRREGRAAPRLVDATGTKRRIQALWALGHNSATIGAAADLTEKHIQQIVLGRDFVTYSTWHTIDRAYRALSTVPGTSDRTRNRARRAGYAPPLAWDDDAIDDPNAQPDLGGDDTDLIDEVAIERALNGERVPLTRTERDHAFRVGLDRGMSATAIGDNLHMSGAQSRAIAVRIRETQAA